MGCRPFADRPRVPSESPCATFVIVAMCSLHCMVPKSFSSLISCQDETSGFNYGDGDNNWGHSANADPSCMTHQQRWQWVVSNATPSYVRCQPPPARCQRRRQQQQQRWGAHRKRSSELCALQIMTTTMLTMTTMIAVMTTTRTPARTIAKTTPATTPVKTIVAMTTTTTMTATAIAVKTTTATT